MKRVNLTAIVVAVILAVAILGYGALSYIQKQNQLAFEMQKQKETTNAQIAKTDLEKTKQANLDKCFKDAQKEFNDTRESNSIAAPTKEFPETRQWKNNDVEESTTKKLQGDKEICIKIYSP